MIEILREIQEDIRQERAQALWDRYGKSVIHAAIAVIIGTALGVGWQHWQKSDHETRTSQLLKGIEYLGAGKHAEAVAALGELPADSTHGRIAALGIARAQRDQGDGAAAQKTYETLAAQAGADAFANLGALLAAKETDAPKAAARDSAFYFSQEEVRGWQLLAAGKKEEAAPIFAVLRDADEAPESLRARARLAADYLGIK